MTKDLTKGSPFRVIVGYLTPVFFSLLLQSLYSVTDAAIVGQTLGADALGGISATGNLNAVTLGFCTGLNAGFCIPIANAFGAGDHGRLRRLFANAAYLCCGAAAVMVLVAAPLTTPLLTAMKTAPENFPYAVSYLRIIFLGAPFSLAYNLCGGVIRSLGDSKMPTVFLAASAVTNVVMDLVLIVIFRMGTAGAALATVCSQLIAFLGCFLYILKKVPVLHAARREWRPDCRLLGTLLRNGVPMALQSVLISFGPLVQRPALNSLGAETVNALAVSGRINSILMCPLSTIGHSIGYYYGQNAGAGRLDRIRQGFRVGVTLSAVFCLLSTLLVYFFAAPLTALFLQTPDPELVEKVRLALLIVNGASFFCGLCSTYRPAVQAMGYAFLSLVPCFVEVGLQIFGALVLIPAFGFVGANLSTAAAWLAVACAVVPMGYRCLDKLCIRLSAYSPSSKEEPL